MDMMMILALFLFRISCWQIAGRLSNFLSTNLPANLTDFSTTFYQQKAQLIVFGGKSGEKYSQAIYILDLNTMQLQNVIYHQAINNSNSCNKVINSSLYIFGQNQIGEENETGFLVRLDLETYQWITLGQNLESLKFCELVEINNNLMVLGGSNHGHLDLFAFDPNTLQFSQLEIEFYGSCQMNVKQWDGSSVKFTLPIEECPAQLIASPNLPPSSFQSSSITSFDLIVLSNPNSMMYYFQTQKGIYSFHINQEEKLMKIIYYSPVDKMYGKVYSKSVKSGNWNIFCNLEIYSKVFYLTFMERNLASRLRVTKNTQNFYTDIWPTFSENMKFSIILQIRKTAKNISLACITVIIHNSFKAYNLHTNVFFLDSTTPVGLLNTFFGLNQCVYGYTGRNCTIPSCPNSFTVNGRNKISRINFQCSGHGKCTQSGCVCDKYWGGDDCNTYLRSNCNGTLLSNFPMNNCQCGNSTIGGNDCTVIFCPGDCFGHGQCINGKCICKQNYFGADCSIMIINFPSAA